jgi:hypothetical protein
MSSDKGTAMPTPHQFNATYIINSANQPDVSWTYDGGSALPSIFEGDQIQFSFSPGNYDVELGEWALVAGPKLAGENWTVFLEGNNIDLKKCPTLNVLFDAGTWGYVIAIAVRHQGGTWFIPVPDPELQVGPR